MKKLIAISAMFFLTSCLPAGWAIDIEEKVECDMSIQEIQMLTDRTIQNSLGPNVTHFISDGLTDVQFVLQDNKLKSVSVNWSHRGMRYATYGQVYLCGPTRSYTPPD